MAMTNMTMTLTKMTFKMTSLHYPTSTKECENVIKAIEGGQDTIHNGKYEIPDIYDQYESYKQFITKPE